MKDTYTVKRIKPRQYQYNDGQYGYPFPARSGVFQNDKPVIFRNVAGRINIEAYKQKYIAQLCADEYNEKGLNLCGGERLEFVNAI